MSKNKLNIKHRISDINLIKEIFLPFLVSFMTVFMVINFGSFITKSTQKNIVKNEVKKVLEETKAPKDKLKDLIELEKSLYIDPLILLEVIDSHDQSVILIDIRDKVSFKKAHIISAVNYSREELLKNISNFKKKKVVIYGDTAYSIETKELALLLIQKNIDVRIMSIGWNEFRHFRNLWLPESDWEKIDVNKYITTND